MTALFQGKEPSWLRVAAAHIDARTLLAPMLVHAFSELRISVSIWLGKDDWYALHVAPNVTELELQYGVMPRRWRYNRSAFSRVLSSRQAELGEHAGFFDLFVPIFEGERVCGLLVAGPFARARPTAAEVLERWEAISNTQGRISDPAFARYLEMTLETPTLTGKSCAAFKRLLESYTDLAGGRSTPEAVATVAQPILVELRETRFAERMWRASDRLQNQRAAGELNVELPVLGVPHLPEHVIAGLIRGRPDEVDPIEDAILRDRFLRACVELARTTGDVACGRVGSHGMVYFVALRNASAAAQRARLSELSSRLRELARRHGLDLYSGVCEKRISSQLAQRSALAASAAQKGLSVGRRCVFVEPGKEPVTDARLDLRAELVRSVAEDPGLLAPRFDRYVQAVLGWSGYRLERTRAELETGLERLAETLLANGFLDKKSFAALFLAAWKRGNEAETIGELVTVYRDLVVDLERALDNPVQGRHERGARRALEFIAEHLEQRLNLPQVARVAGFAPNYFGRMFQRQEGVSFTEYVKRQRLARAKQLLEGTRMTMEQI
ncbi:MAG TPA: AraC family transcriptional regulator, partial [Polyangiaceae bacterium]|nr:AraC family transcriptional regulator [Polyangiaceae bacterium]